MNTQGKVFKYNDNVDTDVIIPGALFEYVRTPQELAAALHGGYRLKSL